MPEITMIPIGDATIMRRKADSWDRFRHLLDRIHMTATAPDNTLMALNKDLVNELKALLERYPRE